MDYKVLFSFRMKVDEGANKMVAVRLVTLECINTKGEKTEEPYLCVYVDGELYGEYGPYSMQQGDTQDLWYETVTIEGNEIIVLLSEEDPGRRGRRDEHYGGVRIVQGEEIENVDVVGSGRYVAHLPPNEKTRYNLYFDIGTDEEDVRRRGQAMYCLELVSLRCNDAQQYADHVYIKVNGERVWGPRRMRTGDFLRMDPPVVRPIHDHTSIQLWEEDKRSRDDFFGELWLRIGGIRTSSGHVVYNLDFNEILPHTFSRDKGISGSARYTLEYILRRRIVDRPNQPRQYRC